MNDDFHRIRRLPPYVFAHIDPIKAKLRAAWKGGDIVLPPEIVRQTLEATGMADFLA